MFSIVVHYFNQVQQEQGGRSGADRLCGHIQAHLLFWFTYVQQHTTNLQPKEDTGEGGVNS